MNGITLKTFIWFLGLQIGCLFILNSSASALNNAGSIITTSPVTVDIATPPGTSTTTNLQVQNNSSSPVNITLKLQEFRADGLSGKAQIYNPPISDPSISWVHFSQTTFTAQPGVWENVVMNINVPKTAAFGYYYAVLFVPKTVLNTTVNTNKVKGANAILVLLDAHVPGESRKLSIEDFSVNKTIFQYLPAKFSVNVHNDGKIFTAPKGDIYISRTLTGKTIDTLDINSGQGNVLPNTNRVFNASWNNGFPYYGLKRINGQIVSDKNGKPVQQLKWNVTNISSFRYGKYYAHLVLVYNDGTRDIAVNGVVTFWVIPWLMLIGVLIFTLLILFSIYSITKVIVRRFKRLRKKN